MCKYYVSIGLYVALTLAGCSEYGYHYREQAHALDPEPVYADCQADNVKNTVDILVDTHGRRMESIEVVAPNGAVVNPKGVDYPAFEAEPIDGYGDGVTSYGIKTAQGPTIAYFDKAAIGPGPWDVKVDLLGRNPREVIVGGVTNKGTD